jgi:hypothetical protein
LNADEVLARHATEGRSTEEGGLLGSEKDLTDLVQPSAEDLHGRVARYWSAVRVDGGDRRGGVVDGMRGERLNREVERRSDEGRNREQ